MSNCLWIGVIFTNTQTEKKKSNYKLKRHIFVKNGLEIPQFKNLVTGILDLGIFFLLECAVWNTASDDWMSMLHYLPAEPLLCNKNYGNFKLSVYSMNHALLQKYENDFK